MAVDASESQLFSCRLRLPDHLVQIEPDTIASYRVISQVRMPRTCLRSAALVVRESRVRGTFATSAVGPRPPSLTNVVSSRRNARMRALSPQLGEAALHSCTSETLPSDSWFDTVILRTRVLGLISAFSRTTRPSAMGPRRSFASPRCRRAYIARSFVLQFAEHDRARPVRLPQHRRCLRLFRELWSEIWKTKLFRSAKAEQA